MSVSRLYRCSHQSVKCMQVGGGGRRSGGGRELSRAARGTRQHAHKEVGRRCACAVKSHQNEDNIKYEGGRRVDNLLPAAE